MYAPSARAMKRGVPPTARKARTGELTPPGMTRRARSKSSALFIGRSAPGGGFIQPASMDVAGTLRRLGRLRFGHGRLGVAGLAFFLLGQGPEEAVRNDIAHARAKARVESLVE